MCFFRCGPLHKGTEGITSSLRLERLHKLDINCNYHTRQLVHLKTSSVGDPSTLAVCFEDESGSSHLELQLPNLKELNLTGCQVISTRTESAAPAPLETLTVTNDIHLTAAGLRKLLQMFGKELKLLDLSHTYVTGRGLGKQAKHSYLYADRRSSLCRSWSVIICTVAWGLPLPIQMQNLKNKDSYTQSFKGK